MNRWVSLCALGLALSTAVIAQDPAPPSAAPGQRDGRGMGFGAMAGRAILGTVTEADADHFLVKNQNGEIYTVHFSANTRMMKQPASPKGQNSGTPPEPGESRGPRTPPTPIQPSDIKVGDAIMAAGEVDASAKSVGAMMVMQLDPERAKEMRIIQANFGKTWLMGKLTAIDQTKLTLQSPVDNATHSFVVDENTSMRKRRDPITLADIQVGDNVRVEGSLKDGTFVATTVAVMPIPARGGPAQRPGPPPQ